jgi:Asp-tRNA(Asn)/Glu-tRNA(Gln) amidotransferase A subunit family amidase
VNDLWSLGVTDLVVGLAQQEWSAAEVLDSIGRRVDALERDLHAWACLDLARAADESTAGRARSSPPTPGGARSLAGVPVAVKDVIATCDLPTGMGSSLFDGFRPREDAVAVSRLRAAGAVIPGKTVTTAFAGPDPAATTNPWDPTRTPGGSSSGSAAAVASGMAPAALGTQTAGSVLRPAAFCGVVGFKPTAGCIDPAGIFPFSRTLDTVGVLARTVGDVDRVFQALRNHPPGASAASRRPTGPGDVERAPSGRPPNRIGVVDCSQVASATAAADCASVAERLSAHDVDVVETRLPVDLEVVSAAQGVIVRAEGASVHQEALNDHPECYGQGLRRLVEVGGLVPAPVYERALRLRIALSAVVDEWCEPGGVLMLPTVDGPVPDRSTTGDPCLQAIFTFLGMPALAIPVGFGADALPLSIQVVARRGDDDHLLDVGAWIQERLAFPVRFPSCE